jgi:DNA polymerase
MIGGGRAMDQQLLNDIIDETAELLRRAAHPKKGTISLAPETAELLERMESSDRRVSVAADPARRDDESALATVGDEGVTDNTPTRTELGGALDPMKALREAVRNCVKCPLCQTRTQTVFADGSPNADLVFVGEAPGFYEDQKGIPFVGKAGQLLTDIIVKGMKIRREDVYICNVIKCRPPDNRDPTPEEKRQCEPYLVQQLKLVKPKVICALGGHAAKTLLKTDESTGKLRGRWHFYEGVPLRVTYHPAYLLRNPADKKRTWEDIQEVMKVLNGDVVPRPPDASGTLFG